MPIRTKQHMDEVKEGIMHALARCISRKGIADVTIADLIAESGLSAGAIYRHFASKDDLLVGLVRHRLKALDEKVLGQELGDTDFWGFVDWTLQRVTTTDHIYLAELEFVSLARVNPHIRAIYVASERSWVTLMKKYLARMPGAGRLLQHPDVVEILIESFRATGNQIILRRMIGLKVDPQKYRRQTEMSVEGAFALIAKSSANAAVGPRLRTARSAAT